MQPVTSALVTVEHGLTPPRLFLVDPSNATTQELCRLAPTAVYDSITFRDDGRLWAHNLTGDNIEVIDPCDCGFQVVGQTGVAGLEMTVDADGGLVGITSAPDAYVEIAPATGTANLVGGVGFVVGDVSIAWSAETETHFLVDAVADQLRVVDPLQAITGEPIPIGGDLSDPGFDAIPGDRSGLYVCSADSLYQLQPRDGGLVLLGSLGMTGPCTTLAGPRTPVACLEGGA